MTRVLFHVQHLLGIGHLKRAELIAAAMAEAGLEVTVALGGLPQREVPFRNVTTVQLPPAAMAGEDFSTLLDATGRPVDAVWREQRAAALLAHYRAIRPNVVLIELYPFGRRQFAFELTPLLEAALSDQPRPAIACSVRDILVRSRKPGRNEAIVATLRRCFDAVLVHGDPALIPFDATFPSAAAIADLIRYTGYVAPAAPPASRPDTAGEVIVSAGGGAVGAPLLEAALAARPLTLLRDRRWRLITGPNLPQPLFDALAAKQDERLTVERFRLDFPSLLAAASLSISQAGYNTTMDILRAGVPAVVVPFETGGETEQRLRAELLARSGVLTVLPAHELSPDRLAETVRGALLAPSDARLRINLEGAATTARMVLTLATRQTVADP